MTVKDFLLHKTQTNELVMIQGRGWNEQAVWIDHEDRFYYHPIYANLEVKDDHWGSLTIRNKSGSYIEVPCHYINTDN